MGTAQLINLLGKWLTPRARMGVKALGHRLLIKFLYNLLAKAIEFIVVFFEFFNTTNKFSIEERLCNWEKKFFQISKYLRPPALMNLQDSFSLHSERATDPKPVETVTITSPASAILPNFSLTTLCTQRQHVLYQIEAKLITLANIETSRNPTSALELSKMALFHFSFWSLFSWILKLQSGVFLNRKAWLRIFSEKVSEIIDFWVAK